MEIKQLPETNITDVLKSPPEQDEQLSPEDQEKFEKFFRSAFVRTNRFALRQIKDRMDKNNLTIEDLRKEIEEKKSPLSKIQRDLLQGFKLEFIQQCINDLKERDAIFSK